MLVIQLWKKRRKSEERRGETAYGFVTVLVGIHIVGVQNYATKPLGVRCMVYVANQVTMVLAYVLRSFPASRVQSSIIVYTISSWATTTSTLCAMKLCRRKGSLA